MADLSDRSRSLLGAMSTETKAWQTPAQVAARLGWSVEETTDLLAELDLAGLIAVRESADADPVVALVPVIAGRPARTREGMAPGRSVATSTAPRNAPYGRPSRPRNASTAVGSVTS